MLLKSRCYSLCFWLKFLLIGMLSAAIPAKKASTDAVLLLSIWLARYRRKNITMLTSPHTTFTVADDRPLPGGFAKGVGNLLPDTPATKCGTTLAKNAPAKKQSIYWSKYSVIKLLTLRSVYFR